jgi:TrkA domain protein
MNEAYLPGVGKKFWLDTAAGEKLTVIQHNDGRYELYMFKKGEEFPSAALTLTEYEAMDAGSVLFGRFEHRIVETMDVVMKDLVIEWAKVGEGSALAGRSIQEMEVRRRTGVSIVAVIRGDKGIPSPSAEEVINKGDLLMLIGGKPSVEKFKADML